MAFQFMHLLVLEKVRSISLSRNIIAGIFLFFFISIVLFYLLGIAVFLGVILQHYFGVQEVIPFLNIYIIFFLTAEFTTRYFLQKRPLFNLEKYLHLPVRRSGIIHFLLIRSLLTPFSLITLFLFLPFTITNISAVYGNAGAFFWLLTLVTASFTFHWIILWIKVSAGNTLIRAFLFVAIPLLLFSTAYYGVFNLGEYTQSFFEWALVSPVPFILLLIFCEIAYFFAFRRYHENAYLDNEVQARSLQIWSHSGGFFSRFGLAGEMADVELKLILRHKKSRGYLIISVLLLLYGLFFYQNPGSGEEAALSPLYLFVGVFITGAFFLQYGQYFLSWNSASFDFFLSRSHGLEALVKGKYLLFFATSFIMFILALPYLYFGWDILAVHTAAFLYNAGIGVHFIIYFSLFDPKPMDINKSSLFNYDGIGIAQLILALPYFIFPYLIYLPFWLIYDDYFALFAVGTIGLAGLIFYEKMIRLSVQKLKKQRYKIASSFRQEI